MKYILVPAPVHILNPQTRAPEILPPVTFREYADRVWLNDQRWYSPMSRLRRLAGVLEAFGNTDATNPEAEKVIELEDQDHATLLEIVQSPDVRNLYALAQVQMQFLPFDDAVIGAQSAAEMAVAG